ncbi:hypothetical protein Glove_151g7 [Diversispora epigaea]|uniref:Uncharacterized protein n=1 Tax=Diversispora epigaea TaxID=1348612 RepID=A0A397J1Y3_9GLOM|nr:hypothetical protein Glove_151g7 [Diversispora epigaea]
MVMLSRVQRLEDLLILWPFKETILNIRLPPSLRAELTHLDECAQKTALLKEWPNHYFPCVKNGKKGNDEKKNNEVKEI